jgi:hypothetical protein
MQFNKEVIERKTSQNRERIPYSGTPHRAGEKYSFREISDALLTALTDGCKETARARFQFSSLVENG